MKIADERKAEELQACYSCESNLGYPVVWEQIDDLMWRVEMRCPNCSSRRFKTVSRETMRVLHKNARLGREVIMKVLDGMIKTNMKESADKFFSALGKDLILPVDFSGRLL